MRAGDIAATLREWVSRAVGLVHRRREDRDLERELAFHVEQAELELRRRGLGSDEAHRLARVRAGNPDRAMEALRAQGGIPWFGLFTLDVVLGLRMLRKHWGLSLVGGLAIAVAIGLSASVFLYFDVTWEAELPLDEPDRVVAIQIWDPASNRRRETPVADFERWRAQLTTLEHIAAFRTVERNVDSGERRAAVAAVAEMTSAGFRVARAAPLLGRTFDAADEQPGADPVAVIGYDEWQRRFGGDRDVLGRTLRLDDTAYTIVGVMPEAFAFPINHQLWVPLVAVAGADLPAPPVGSAIARLVPGFEVADATAELAATGLLPDAEAAEEAEPLRLLVLPYRQNFMDDIDPDDYARRTSNARLVVLLMSLLLLPPGVNIAMLVYARTVTRQEEIAVRTALGASRARIVTQLFIEMLVLAAIAAAVALVGVRLVAHYVEAMMVQQLVRLPFWIDIRLSLDTMLFAAALAVAAALVTGLVPALRATRRFARPGIGALEARHRARLGGLWTALIVAQVAFSFVALPVAVEIAWGLLRADVLGPGFRAEQYLTAQLSLAEEAPSPAADDAAERSERFAAARESFLGRLEAEPAVIGAPTLASSIPGGGPWARVEITADTTPVEAASPWQPRNSLTRAMQVDPAYFDMLEASPLIGRGFAAGEFMAPSRAIVVSEQFVARTLEGVAPLGLRIRYVGRPDRPPTSGTGDDVWYEIVGVVPDVPAHPYRGTIYHPLTRGSVASARMILRVAPGTPGFDSRLRELAAATRPPLRVTEVTSLAEVYEQQAFGNYVGGFALIAGTLCVLLLAGAGTYALMSFTVNDRRREIGIRVALGAPRGRLLRAVLKRAMRQVLIGAAVGVALALFIERKVPAETIGGLDVPGVLPAAALIVTLVGLLAAAGPARRALRIDPNQALRDGG